MSDPLNYHIELIDKMKQVATQRENARTNKELKSEAATRRRKGLKQLLWGVFWGGSGVFWLYYELAQSGPHRFTVLMQLLLICIGGLGILAGLIQLYRAIGRGVIDWHFGLLWGAFSSLGLIVGFTLYFIIVGILVTGIETRMGQPLSSLPSPSVGKAMLMLSLAESVVGLGLSSTQWLLLRKQISRSGLWPAATILAFALVSVVTSALNIGVDYVGGTLMLDSPASLLVTIVSQGMIVGGAQWLVLRRYAPRAGWWVVASILGFSGLAAGTAVQENVMLSFFLILVWYGIVTAPVMVWVLRHAVSEE